MIQIIDTHVHFWELGRFRMPEIDNYPDLARDFTLSDFKDASNGLNIKKAVYMEVNLIQEQRYSEARYITEILKDDTNQIAAAFIGGNPLSYSFKDYVTLFKDNPYVKGVRQVLHPPERPKGLCLENKFVDNIKFLGSLGLMFSICMRPAELGDAVKLAELCPETTFILDHCGNANPGIVNGSVKSGSFEHGIFFHEKDRWYSEIYELSERDNVVCKISGLSFKSPKEEARDAGYFSPAVDHCLDSFGPDRVVFGGNWPVCTISSLYREWVENLKEIVSCRSEIDQKKLFHDNAVRIYSL